MYWQFLILTNTLIFAIVLGLIDFKTYLLPNKYVLLLTLSNLILLIFEPNFKFLKIFQAVLSAFIILCFYLLLYFLSKKTFGLGDVKYSFAISIPVSYYFGFNQALNLHILAFVLGGFVAIFLILFKKAGKNHPIAFGPYISISYFLFLVLNLRGVY